MFKLFKKKKSAAHALTDGQEKVLSFLRECVGDIDNVKNDTLLHIDGELTLTYKEIEFTIEVRVRYSNKKKDAHLDWDPIGLEVDTIDFYGRRINLTSILTGISVYFTEPVKTETVVLETEEAIALYKAIYYHFYPEEMPIKRVNDFSFLKV